MSAVPWCDECDTMVEDEDLTEDGECPQCGSALRGRKIAWSFKVLIVATVVYLGYRGYQLVTIIVHHI